MENVVHFTVNHHGPVKDLYQMRFDWPICNRPKGRYPVCFHADQVTRFDLEDPGFDNADSTIVMSLVASLIKDGHTGVESVIVASSRVIKIYYDPKQYPPHLLKKDIRSILRDVDRHGWVVKFGW